MTYHININKSNLKEFLQIMTSLKSLGVVNSIKSTRELVVDGTPLKENELLNILAASEKEIATGSFFTQEEARKQIESWKNR